MGFPRGREELMSVRLCPWRGCKTYEFLPVLFPLLEPFLFQRIESCFFLCSFSQGGLGAGGESQIWGVLQQ